MVERIVIGRDFVEHQVRVAIHIALQPRDRFIDFEQQGLADAVFIRTAVNLGSTKTRTLARTASELASLLGSIQDYSVRLWIRMSLAQYEVSTGRKDVAIRELRAVVENAASSGYAVQELESMLLLAQTEQSLQERSQLLKTVYIKSSLMGLNRIARNAMDLSPDALRRASLSANR